jgi:hypothetical protein
MELHAENITITKAGRRMDGAWLLSVSIPEDRTLIEGGCSPQLRIRHDFSVNPDVFTMHIFHSHGDEVIILDEEEYETSLNMYHAEQDARFLNGEEALPEDEVETDFKSKYMTWKSARAFFGVDFQSILEQLKKRWEALQLIVNFQIGGY